MYGVTVQAAISTGTAEILGWQGQTWWFLKSRYSHFSDPHNEKYGILGSVLGSPCFGKLPMVISTAALQTHGEHADHGRKQLQLAFQVSMFPNRRPESRG